MVFAGVSPGYFRTKRFRGAGLSRSKTAAIKDLAAKTIAGVVPSLAALERMGDEEIITCLTAVREASVVGPWRCCCSLISAGLDVWPVDDYGVRKGYAQTFRNENCLLRKSYSSLARNGDPTARSRPGHWRALELPPERTSAKRV